MSLFDGSYVQVLTVLRILPCHGRATALSGSAGASGIGGLSTVTQLHSLGGLSVFFELWGPIFTRTSGNWREIQT